MTDEREIHKLIDKIHMELGCRPSRTASVCERLEIIRRAVHEFSYWLAAIRRNNDFVIAKMARDEAVKWIGEQHGNEAIGNIGGIMAMAGFSDDDANEAIDIAAEFIRNRHERYQAQGEDHMREEEMWHQVGRILSGDDA